MIVSLRPFLAATVLAPVLLATAGSALAQDVAPDTPKELKDFKLNPENAPPVRQPLPTTEPVVKAPVMNAPAAEVPAVRVPPVQPAKVNPTPSKPAPAKPAPTEPAAVTPRKVAPVVAATPAFERNSDAADAASVAAPQVTDDAAVQGELIAEQPILPETSLPGTPPAIADVLPPADAAPASTLPWSYILAAFFVVLGLAVAAMIKRRRKGSDADETETMFEQIEDPADRHHIVMPNTAAPPDKAALPANTNRPKLEISFAPETASVSLANLTIKGRLRIINSGTVNAAAMQLNAVVISASEGQNDAISRFFNSPLLLGKDLGVAKVGEQIALEMDLMIPIADLQTFIMGKQKLLVPIIMARVEYYWGDGAQQHDEAQLSCLIGREASPPKPKMGPLRLDLGPRSFASLGQRPVFG